MPKNVLNVKKCIVFVTYYSRKIDHDVNIDIYLTIASYFIPYMVKISTKSYSLTFLVKETFPLDPGI